MKRWQKILISIAAIFVLVGLFGTNTYYSSPGLTTEEGYAAFLATKPTCYGLSILLNRSATMVDAPGESLCIGILKY
jgi:hypothetical protein